MVTKPRGYLDQQLQALVLDIAKLSQAPAPALLAGFDSHNFAYSSHPHQPTQESLFLSCSQLNKAYWSVVSSLCINYVAYS